MSQAVVLENRLLRLQAKVAESWEYYLDRYVNPAERFEGWMDITPAGFLGAQQIHGSALQEWRALGRRLAFTNPFAINGHQNLQNFIAGVGYTYKIQDPAKRSTYARAIKQAMDYWDEFVEREAWDEKEAECILRADRDGEAIVRTFIDFEGAAVRFVDPDAVRSSRPSMELGIVTRPGDAQKIIGFIIEDQETVPAEEIVFFKKNTDSDVHRGVPTFLPVVEPLEGAKKMLRVTRKMAEIQAAIAVVREHPEGTTGTKIAALADAAAQRTPTDGTSGSSFRQRVIQPGTIMDVPPGQKYHFPIAGQGADKMQVVVNLLLRAAAARVSQPEFIFSMDASQSNYASLVAAEQPGMRAFEKQQAWYSRRFRSLFKRVILIGVIQGRLSQKLLDPTLKYSAKGPAVRSRDRFSIVRSNDLLVKGKIKSRRTVAEEEGLDFDREMQYREEDGDDKALVPPKDPNKAVGTQTGQLPKGNE